MHGLDETAAIYINRFRVSFVGGLVRLALAENVVNGDTMRCAVILSAKDADELADLIKKVLTEGAAKTAGAVNAAF